jgi:hypothetical protein
MMHPLLLLVATVAVAETGATALVAAAGAMFGACRRQQQLHREQRSLLRP